jgi:uncharacterized protein (DUF934 family)
VESLAGDLPRLVALQFPKWTDGRAYSQAHVLRARLRYAGEVRAIGDVLVDMLPLLHRTGFSAVQLRADQKEASARRALAILTDHYQGDVPARGRLLPVTCEGSRRGRRTRSELSRARHLNLP